MIFIIKLIKNIILYSLSLPFFLVILILSSLFNIRLHFCDSERIGHFLFDFLAYMEMKKKPLVIWIINKNVCNRFLLKKAKKKFLVIDGLFSIFFTYVKLINQKTINVSFIYLNETENKFPQKKSTINRLIYFNQSEFNKCTLNLKKIGITDKFICLHVRDQAYLKKNKSSKEKINSFRNCNINNYIKLIKFFISKGYFVLRMGDNSQKKIRYKNPKFIQYNISKLKSNEMDFFLAKKCSFFVGTSSGWEAIVESYKKKGLITNLPNFVNADWTNQKFFIFKKFFFNKKIIRLREILNNKFANLTNSKLYKIKNIKLIQNSSDELLKSSKEFYKFLICKKKTSKEFQILNNKLKYLINKNYNPFYKKKEGFVAYFFLKKYL